VLLLWRQEGDQNRTADAVLAEIDTQIETGFFRLVDASQSSIYAKAQELSNKHTPAVATRSPGLMHLAAALLFGARTFLTFDKRQAKAAFTGRREIACKTLILSIFNISWIIFRVAVFHGLRLFPCSDFPR
jgi:hypothetical protein